LKEKANERVQSLIIGKKFPADVSMAAYDSPTFQIIGSESAVVIWHIKDPKPLELNDFNNGKVKIGVMRYGKVMFFCIDQQPFANGDCAFHASLYRYPKDMHLMHSTTDAGLPVYLCVVDEKGILRALRCINLNKAVTDKISDIFEFQRTEDGLVADSQFRQTVISAYQLYQSAEDMINSCEAFCEIKGRLVT
jgi:hypothetical protein